MSFRSRVCKKNRRCSNSSERSQGDVEAHTISRPPFLSSFRCCFRFSGRHPSHLQSHGSKAMASPPNKRERRSSCSYSRSYRSCSGQSHSFFHQRKEEDGLSIRTSSSSASSFLPHFPFNVGVAQVTQLARAGLEVVYVSGWACSSLLTTGANEIGPDLG